MIYISKKSGQDFKILNLADVQMGKNEWEPTHKFRQIFDTTLDELVSRVKPDLITMTGDQAWCGDSESLEELAKKLDTYGIPYALVWGNHDQDGGKEKLSQSEKVFFSHSLFRYESGPSELGYGNYVIGIKEGDKLVHALIMMDSHDHAHCYDSEGKEIFAWGTTPAWGKLYPEQIEWYKEQVKMLKEMGCPSSSIFMHIPCFAYHAAFDSAFAGDTTAISLADSYKAESWKQGYQDSFGVKYEGICSFPQEDGVFDAVVESDHTKHIIVGHDHKNCFSVVYKGVRLSFAMKTGAGCYWTPELNGGSVLTINESGAVFSHEIVDVSSLL